MRNHVIEDIISTMSDKRREELQIQVEQNLRYLVDLEDQGKFFGTATSITLEAVRGAGFNPIGICWYGGEETLIFKTKKEADTAYRRLEKQQKKIYAWWYSKKDFEKEIIKNSKFYEPIGLEWL